MDFGFGERDAHAQDGPLAVGRDGRGDQQRTVDDAAAVTDFFITGVEQHERRASQRRLRQAESSTSSSSAARLTCMLVTSVPQSSRVIAATRRVETPWTYISARASFKARSLRSPRSKAKG